MRELEQDGDYLEHGLDELTIDTVGTSNEEHAMIKLNNVNDKLKLDSGAEANVLTKWDFNSVGTLFRPR